MKREHCPGTNRSTMAYLLWHSYRKLLRAYWDDAIAALSAEDFSAAVAAVTRIQELGSHALRNHGLDFYARHRVCMACFSRLRRLSRPGIKDV